MMNFASADKDPDHVRLDVVPWRAFVKVVISQHTVDEALAKWKTASRIVLFDSSVQFLDAFGLVDEEHNDDENYVPEKRADITPKTIAIYRRLMQRINDAGGASEFVEGTDGMSLRQMIAVAQGFGSAGLLTDDPQQEQRNIDRLKEFLKRVKDSGGFESFLWCLRNVDIASFQQNTHTLSVLKDAMHDAAADAQWAWRVLEDQEVLVSLFTKIRECGGIDQFLQAVDSIENLITFAEPMGGVNYFMRGITKELGIFLHDTRLVDFDISVENRIAMSRDLLGTIRGYGGAEAFASTAPLDFSIGSTLRGSDAHAASMEWEKLSGSIQTLGGVIPTITILNVVNSKFDNFQDAVEFLSNLGSKDARKKYTSSRAGATYTDMDPDAEINARMSKLKTFGKNSTSMRSMKTLSANNVRRSKVDKLVNEFNKQPSTNTGRLDELHVVHEEPPASMPRPRPAEDVHHAPPDSPQSLDQYGSFHEVPRDHRWEQSGLAAWQSSNSKKTWETSSH
jgi:hypothetical protein